MVLLRKSQVEMFGLVIIVILIVIIALFAIKFALRPKVEEKPVKLGLIANNLLNAIVKANICNDKSFDDALIACGNKVPLCDNEACSLVKKELEMVMSKFGYNYKFIASIDKKEYFVNGECSDGIASTSYVSRDGSSLYSYKIYLCYH